MKNVEIFIIWILANLRITESTPTILILMCRLFDGLNFYFFQTLQKWKIFNFQNLRQNTGPLKLDLRVFCKDPKFCFKIHRFFQNFQFESSAKIKIYMSSNNGIWENAYTKFLSVGVIFDTKPVSFLEFSKFENMKFSCNKILGVPIGRHGNDTWWIFRWTSLDHDRASPSWIDLLVYY